MSKTAQSLRMPGYNPKPGMCEHTPSPSGIVEDLGWMEAMTKAGYIQTQCLNCGLWAVWIKPQSESKQNVKEQ